MDRGRNSIFPICLLLPLVLVMWHIGVSVSALDRTQFYLQQETPIEKSSGNGVDSDFLLDKLPKLDSLSNKSQQLTLTDTLAAFYLAEQKWIDLARVYLYQSRLYLSSSLPDKAENSLNECFKALKREVSSEENVLYVEAYDLRGKVFESQQSIADAIEAYDKALGLSEIVYGGESRTTAEIAITLGNLYAWELRDYFEAEKYYEKAHETLEKIEGAPLNTRYNAIYGLASAKRNQEDMEKALNYAFKTLTLITEQERLDTVRWRYALTIIANVYNDYPGKIDKAIPYYKKLLKISPIKNQEDSISYGSLNHGVAVSYMNMGQHDTAYYYSKQAEKYLKPIKKDTEDHIWMYSVLGKLTFERGDHKEAEQYLYKSIRMSQRANGAFHAYASSAYHYLAELHFELKHYSTALKLTQKSLMCWSNDWNPTSLNDNPAIEELREKSRAIETFILKGKCLTKLYEQTGNTSYLHNALYTYNFTDELFRFLRQSYNSENSILTNSEYYKDLYDNVLGVIYDLALRTQNDNYLDMAFLFMEKNSAGLLLENLIDAESKYEIGINDSILSVEREIRAEIDQIQGKIQLTNGDDGDLSLLRERLFTLNEKLDAIESRIEEKFPAYYNIKYRSQDFVTPSKIRKNLEKGDLYVSYYVGSKYIYGLGLRKREGIRIFRIENNDSLQNALNNVLDVFSNQNASLYHMDSYQAYVDNSYYLYNKLLKQIIEELDVESNLDNLILVTNGKLGLLPFESLLTAPTRSYSAPDYKILNYLIKRFRVQYAYSGTLYDRYLNESPFYSRAKVLAFGYSEDTEVSVPGKAELKGSVYELEALKSMIIGDFLQGKEATETAFKNKARSSEILHLALHGEANTENPHGSALYFRSQADEQNDGRLYPYELYPLNLNSRLVVLSSCETGIGKNYSGEGIYSIGRSFSYAGCPSIVMTLWKLNDRVTASIMEDFYKGLTKGQELDKALRQSKLNYLAQSDELTAHPVNWAAFVAIGDMRPVKPMEKKKDFYLWAAIALIIPTLLLAVKMLLFKKE
ncbi:CHAT domain-containing protein [Roseivirga sp. BDSF3-8]|uniref:CHAT domain-containing protein n=1 Tax=Roseivirga sp. BDSF3-8 TaxID=3241598 RepID=UPI003531D67A